MQLYLYKIIKKRKIREIRIKNIVLVFLKKSPMHMKMFLLNF